MPELLTSTTDALAVFRLTRLIVQDSLFDGPRDRLLARLDVSHPKLSEGLSCPFCVSVYVAAGVVVARRVAPRAWGLAAEALALSAVAGLLSERST